MTAAVPSPLLATPYRRKRAWEKRNPGMAFRVPPHLHRLARYVQEKINRIAYEQEAASSDVVASIFLSRSLSFSPAVPPTLTRNMPLFEMAEMVSGDAYHFGTTTRRGYVRGGATRRVMNYRIPKQVASQLRQVAAMEGVGLGELCLHLLLRSIRDYQDRAFSIVTTPLVVLRATGYAENGKR